MRPFAQLLEESVRLHGHLCPGQVLGVRMAMKGCALLGIEAPEEAVYSRSKKMIVYVEIDRCATDAISSVTGCKLGKRTMKFKDYGIMAATFVNLETGQAFRVSAREEAKTLATRYAPGIEDRHKRELLAYQMMPDEELFEIEEVIVNIPTLDLPGRPRKKVQCHSCGEWIRDGREKRENGTILCQICAGGAYFRRFDDDERPTTTINAGSESYAKILWLSEREDVSEETETLKAKAAKP